MTLRRALSRNAVIYFMASVITCLWLGCCALAFHVGNARTSAEIPPIILHMPVCKTGWKMDTRSVSTKAKAVLPRYVPMMFSLTNNGDGLASIINDQTGEATAVPHGKTVVFDCFDMLTRDTI